MPHAPASRDSGYTGFVGAGNVEITDPDAPFDLPLRLPQMVMEEEG